MLSDWAATGPQHAPECPGTRGVLFQPSPALWPSGVAGVAVSGPVRSPTASARGMSCRSQGTGVRPVRLWKSGLAVWSTGASRVWSASSPCVSFGGRHQRQSSDPGRGLSLGWTLPSFCLDSLSSPCERGKTLRLPLGTSAPGSLLTTLGCTQRNTVDAGREEGREVVC